MYIYVWIYENNMSKIMGMFLENQLDIVHKYDHVALRVLSTLCTLNIGPTMPIHVQAVEVAANE